MKIRKPWLIKAAALLGKTVGCGLMASLRFRLWNLGAEEINPHRLAGGKRFIYALWHEYLLLPAFHFARRDMYVLIGQHADGELAAEVCRFLRFPTIRGSATRGGVEAVRQILRKTGRTAHLAITVDGPRGPRRRVQPGVVYLAARTGMPIVAGGFGFDRPWRLRSWDRFAVPRPGTLATCVTGPPLVVPPDASKGRLEEYRLRLEATLLAVTAAAEQWAETGLRQRPALSEQEGRRRAG